MFDILSCRNDYKIRKSGTEMVLFYFGKVIHHHPFRTSLADIEKIYLLARYLQTMRSYLVFLPLISLVLLGFMAGCVSPPPPGNQTRSCSVDSDCVPEQCCHPTSCINRTLKQACNEACTLECRGPIDCGAGHCGCINGTCQVRPGSPGRFAEGERSPLVL